mgnify:CR=1 FL=1
MWDTEVSHGCDLDIVGNCDTDCLGICNRNTGSGIELITMNGIGSADAHTIVFIVGGNDGALADNQTVGVIAVQVFIIPHINPLLTLFRLSFLTACHLAGTDQQEGCPDRL